MSSKDQKPAEKKPQFVQRPMKLFNTLSQRKEPYPVWLLTEYVTRWTVNWYDHEEVLLSDDEFCNGRRKPNGERYDGGLPLKRTAAREYLAYAIEHSYLEARDVGDPLKRKAWRLHPQFHPKTCSYSEQVESEEGYLTAKAGEPVRVANRSYSPDEQIPMRDANRSYSPNAQVPCNKACQEAARRAPIEISYRDRFTTSIETLAPDEKIEEEQTKETDPSPCRPADASIPTSTQAADVGAGLPTAGPGKASERPEETEEEKHARYQAWRNEKRSTTRRQALDFTIGQIRKEVADGQASEQRIAFLARLEKRLEVLESQGVDALEQWIQHEES